MICQDSRAPNISIEFEIFGGGGGGGKWEVRTLSIENLNFNGKNWSSGILANHSFFANPPGSACLFFFINSLIQDFIEFICINIDFIRYDLIDPLCQRTRVLYTVKICVFS